MQPQKLQGSVRLAPQIRRKRAAVDDVEESCTVPCPKCASHLETVQNQCYAPSSEKSTGHQWVTPGHDAKWRAGPSFFDVIAGP